MSEGEFIKVVESNGYDELDNLLIGAPSSIGYKSQDHRVLLFYDPDTYGIGVHVDDQDFMSLGWLYTQSWNKLNAFLDVCDCQQLVI